MKTEFEKLAAAGKIEGRHVEPLTQLVEGGCCSHRSWGFGKIKTVDTVFARFTIDFPGKPGHTMDLSFAADLLKPIPKDHILARKAADLEAVRAKFAFPKFDLVGDSFGGFLAMAYAAAHPEHVDKLILSDSAAPALKNIVRLLPQVFPDMMERSSDPQEQMRNHFRMLFYSEEKRDAYLAGAKDLGYSPQVGAAVSRAISKVDLTAQLPKFTFPTMVITGRYDMNVAPLTAWNIYKAIPGAKFVVFAKSGHLPSYEEPDKYVQTIDAFLSGR